MKIDDAILLAYVDGELPGDECVKVEHAIHESAEIAARVSMLRASQLPYAEAFDQQSLPPVPESLSRSVDDMIRQHRANASARQHAAGVADASSPGEPEEVSLGENVHRLKPRVRSLPTLSWPKLAVAFVAGAFCCGLALRLVPQLAGNGNSNGGSAGITTASNDAVMMPWIRAAAGYQQLYTRDTVALLQPDMNVTTATVADIRHVDNLAMQIPDLSGQGLTFKRVQRLRFHDKALVQIVYLPQKGNPVALCVLKEAKADAAPSDGNVHGMAVVSWRRGQLGYALIAEPGTVDLDALSKQLYNGQVTTTVGSASNGAPEPRV
ncbi:anti-sigma factor [Paraburkholderia sp. BL21I4N1]|uniref:anti-sigma factor family protein n=1 Tax=Paraburkholderia sp. BL21I4N1 TaxID=1938801 RepID=UPI000CFC9340|nr:anti-sigma factor [Paraburkholderia sp. BL21I4N1]PQV54470.1 anti-sigma factor RsiW [Paraburkholderia sp. BL21I4N1]